MENLHTPMITSYREHPAFTFTTPSWELEAEKASAFNDAYLAATQLSHTLNKTSRNALYQHCFIALSDVFSHIKQQYSDTYEADFLFELENASHRLLREELAWYALPRSSDFFVLPQKAQQDAIQMQSHQYYFGQLPGEAVNEMLGLGRLALEQCRINAANGHFTREDLSVNDGEAVRAIIAVLNSAFKNLGVLDIVSAYTGRKTIVSGLSLELSIPQATWWKNSLSGLTRAPKTLYAHLDESISLPKSIVYLSDVSEANGPTSCYPDAYTALGLSPLQEIIGRIVGNVGNNSGSLLKEYYGKQYHQSINSENFRRHFMRLPEILRFNSHMGWDVLPDSDLERHLVSIERKMIGPAGTFIAFDGARLFHRGGLMEQGERIALQVIFSDPPPSLGKRIYNKFKRIMTP